jgi:hypothetical protein
MHLREISVGIFGLAPGKPFATWLGNVSSIILLQTTAVAGAAVGGNHADMNPLGSFT